MSLELLYGQDDIVERYVAQKIPGCSRGFGACRAVGVLKDGELVGGYVYHNWSPETGVIEISAASEGPHWMNLTILREIFGWPFTEKGGCQLIVMRVHLKNRLVRDILKRIGSAEYVIPHLRGPGRKDSECVLTLKDKTWRESRYFGGSNGEA